MNIAVLNWRDLSHPRSGGAEVYVDRLCRQWTGEGHDVTLYSSVFPKRASVSEDSSFRIVRVGRLADLSHFLLAPAAVVRCTDHDVVLESINTLPYLLPLRRSFPPFVSLVHQLAVDVWHSHLIAPGALLAKWIEPRLYRPYRCSPVLAVSPSTQRDLLRTKLTDVVVVPQGGLGRQRPIAKSAFPVLVFVGRLSPNKRPDHAVAAFRLIRERIPGVRLWIIGDGPMRGELQRGLPEGAELLGRLARDELRERMGSAHLLLVPSVREGWGLVVTEANALGTPAVAYDVPGLRDSVRDNETGLLTKSDPDHLAQTVMRLMNDSTLYAYLRRNAMEWGGAHTWDQAAASVLGHLARAAGGARDVPAD